MEIITKKEIYNKLADVMKLIVFINSETKVDLFARFSGHVNSLEVHYHENGWRKNKTGMKIGETPFYDNENEEDKFDGDKIYSEEELNSIFPPTRTVDWTMEELNKIEAKLLEIAKDENLDLTEIGM